MFYKKSPAGWTCWIVKSFFRFSIEGTLFCLENFELSTSSDIIFEILRISIALCSSSLMSLCRLDFLAGPWEENFFEGSPQSGTMRCLLFHALGSLLDTNFLSSSRREEVDLIILLEFGLIWKGELDIFLSRFFDTFTLDAEAFSSKRSTEMFSSKSIKFFIFITIFFKLFLIISHMSYYYSPCCLLDLP
ncbi:unnamed protein product [Moneuplotes crassus]|uniref:Uncharacterized protein n=1 Tax=Euplotes crassus TaxID=5936 RepID=A0AAD2D2H3_EUPCR|nr:unnamed protein product [Moneuplotes crassus]